MKKKENKYTFAHKALFNRNSSNYDWKYSTNGLIWSPTENDNALKIYNNKQFRYNGKLIWLHLYSSSIAFFTISIERICMSVLQHEDKPHSSCTEWKKKKLYVQVKREILVFSFYFVFIQHWMISLFEFNFSSI